MQAVFRRVDELNAWFRSSSVTDWMQLLSTSHGRLTKRTSDVTGKFERMPDADVGVSAECNPRGERVESGGQARPEG